MENVCVPIGLDAFTLSPESCSPDANILIAPLTQPSYIGLRLDGSVIQHDVLNYVDLHNTTPATSNPRITDIGSDNAALKYNRLGVYLHWTLPRMFRTAIAPADSARGYPGSDGKTVPNPNPVFRPVPNRWLIIRNLKKSDPAVPLGLTSWVIESDRFRYLSDIDKTTPDLDLESDVTPFVAYDSMDIAKDPLSTQTEVFIGNKVPLPFTESTNVNTTTPLTIMNSSNPLFPDYVPHNANVFSTIDDFEYFDSTGNKNYLKTAIADYLVLGWHSDGTQDPFASTEKAFMAHLSDLLLQRDPIDNATADSIKATNASNIATRLLCHSAVYNVQYFQGKRTPSSVDAAAARFTNEGMEPISVGSTPLDGMLSFLDAHNHTGEETKFFGPDGDDLASKVLALKELLYAANDDYDSRVTAQDLVFEQNYAPSDGGSVWSYASATAPGGTPNQPSTAVQTALAQMNEMQLRLDAANRKAKSLQWELFAEWWKFVSDQSNQSDPVRISFRPRVKQIRDQLDILAQVVKKLGGSTGDITTSANEILAKQTARPPYFTRKDPTLCIAGMDSGWPADYIAPAVVRLDHQLPDSTKNHSSTDTLFPLAGSPVPIDNKLRETAQRLVAEFLTFPIADTVSGQPAPASRPGAKAWNNTNPFVPLFIEYELLYYHIDISKWEIYQRQSPFNHATSHLRYGISENKPPLYSDSANQQDIRSLTGRVILLPQPVFDLAAIVQQVTSNLPKGFSFDSATASGTNAPPLMPTLPTSGPNVPTPAAIPPTLDEQVATLNRNVGELKFISAPLTGLTEHLLTRSGGSHVKPNVRLQGQDVFPLQKAVEVSNLATAVSITNPKPIQPNENLDATALHMIGGESALTPYGNLVDFSSSSGTAVPFKGVTHGQMVFTKLAIIDKFGQAISLPSAKPRQRIDTQASEALYPCLSDSLAPSTLPPATGSGLPYGNLNTILKEADVVKGKTPLCRFMQLTPSINQDARLNAAFVKRKPNSAGAITWQETTDYDQPAGPVWGWVVINYADSGLQFFLGDGTFYREVRMGGVNGTSTSQKWIPFDAPTKTGQDSTLSGTDNAQLDALISNLNTSYLQSFSDMINGSIKTMPFPPSAYSQFANSIVGKPLALVNVGWSVELAAPAIKAQNTLGPNPGNEEDVLSNYSFPLKIGDADRPFDGVVGYWESNNAVGSVDTQFNKCYTYFAPDDPTGKATFQGINPGNFHGLNPKYVTPEFSATANMTEAVALNYYVTSLLIDPYTPLHGYSPILPIKTLTLPPWCIESAFSKMTAFFRLGPQLLTKDIPTDYTAYPHATSESWSIPPPASATTAPIRLPITGKKGMWKWLQPYRVEAETKFNSLDVGEEDTQIRNDPAPYTFVEGYLQLAAPVLQPPTI